MRRRFKRIIVPVIGIGAVLLIWYGVCRAELFSAYEPVALRLGFAFKSSNSASNKTFSINSCTPVPFLAEISCD